jgi:mannose-6-phosphate isomerase
MVWGGRGLGEVLGKALPAGLPCGESWEVSDHGSHHSVVADGPLAGCTLRGLLQRHPGVLLGSGAARNGTPPPFPWLVKYLDACDWLSVQVHPDDEAVTRLWPGEGGKTEAWFVLAARPGSRVYAGLLPGVDEKALRAALGTGTVADCLHQFTPRPGDCLFLPAGTVHAVGGGVLIAEVQQTSDATFRLFDWNRRDAQGRSRALHIEESLACIDWKAGPVHPIRADGYPPSPGEPSAPHPVAQRLVTCPYFELDYVRRSTPWTWGGTGRMQVVMALHGGATLHTREGEMAVRTGDSLLLPAEMPETACRPEGALGVLIASLPPKESP